MVYPDLHNYDLASLARAGEGEGPVVESVSRALGSVVSRLDWARVVVVVVSSGPVTARVVDRLVDDLCVEHVVSLQSGPGQLQSPGGRALEELLVGGPEVRLVVVTQTTDQVTTLLTSLANSLGWDVVSQAEVLAWSYIQTNDLLAEMAEELLGLSLHLVADTEQEEVSTELVAARMMESLGSGLSDYSARHCPDTETILSCVREF